MSIFTRRDSQYYWVRFQISGYRVRESTRIINTPSNKSLAKEYEINRKAEILEKIKAKPYGVKVWQEGVLKWLSDPNVKKKKTLSDDKNKLVYLNTFLRDKPLDCIDDTIMNDALDAKFKKDDDGKLELYQPTANRYLSVVQSILYLNKIQTKLSTFPERKKRIRWITENEAQKLLFELHKNADHLANMAEFTLATGLRETNCRLLKWSQLDMARKTAWFYGDEMKGKRDLGIPLNDDAIRVLKRCLGNHDEYVFTYKSKPVGKCSTKAWYKAKDRADIKSFKWHDLRHTWASWHVQRGTSLPKLMELGGWKDYDMVLRYAHLSVEHLKEDAERVNRTKPALTVVK